MAVSVSLTYLLYCNLWHSNNILSCQNSRANTGTQTEIHSALLPDVQGRRMNGISEATVSFSLLLVVCRGVWGESKDIFVITMLVQVDQRAFLQHGATLIRGTNIVPVAGWLRCQLLFFFFFAWDKNAGAAGSTFSGTSADRNLVLMFGICCCKISQTDRIVITDMIVV